MTEVPGPDDDPVAEAPTRKVGWYRDRNTGKRQFWNGVTWIDVAGEVTAFTLGPRRPTTPAQTSPRPRNARDKRLKVIVGAVAVLVVVAAVTLAVVLSDTGTTPTRGVTSSTIAPADTPASFPSTSKSSASPTTIGATTGSGIGTGAVSTSTITGPPERPHSVVLVGDSITVRTTPDLEHDLRAFRVILDGVDGSTMAEHLATIDSIEARGGTFAWIVELGTNDTTLKNPNWASDFSKEVSALQGQPCVVFVTVNPKLGPIGTGIDQAIATAVALHPNFRSLDWGNIEFRKPHWLVSDGIHPSKTGEAELARLEHKAVLGCSA